MKAKEKKQIDRNTTIIKDGLKPGVIMWNRSTQKKTNAAITINNRKTTIQGFPEILARVGDDYWDNELVFNFFRINDTIEIEPAETKHDRIEYYLPLEEGIEFLEKAVVDLKKWLGKEKKSQDLLAFMPEKAE